MISISRIKSCDFFRKTPRDLTEASLSGAGISIIAAISMISLFGMELHNYLTLSTSTMIIVDKSSDNDSLNIDFNISFPGLSCEFASVDVSDVLGTNRLNITKTVRKFTIDKHLQSSGAEFYSVPVHRTVKHDDKIFEAYGEGSVPINSRSFDKITHEHPIVVINFYAPWCHWSNRLKPSWDKAAKVIRQRYNPDLDGRIVVGSVDCTKENDLCQRHHIQGYPSIRIFHKGTDARGESVYHTHETYYGDRDADSLVLKMEELAQSVGLDSTRLYSLTADVPRIPAPSQGGCRIEGFVRVKKVPGYLIIAATSGSHSFDASQINMSHVISNFSFGSTITPRVMSDIKRVVPYLGESHGRLNGQAYIITNPEDCANVTIEHYLQVVKTEVMGSSYQMVDDYEYTAHTSLIHAPSIPAAKFHLEFSPMQVLLTENSKSFSHFITNVCAIIGGVFTVAGILDSILYNTYKLAKKVELGKNF